MQLKIKDTTRLVLASEQGSEIEVHPIWLRERNEDPAVLDGRTRQRLFDPSDLPLDLAFERIVDLGDGRLQVAFSDQVEAVYSVATLEAEIALPPGDHDCPAVVPWTAELDPLPRGDWSETLSPEQLFDLTTKFLTFGFVVLSGVPSQSGHVLKVGSTFGHVRSTNFGDLFDVRSVPQANDLAYTSVELGAHTDNPYRTPAPGVQLLHCLTNQTTGGLSTLVDGLAVAHALRERDPEAFAVLTTTPVRFRFWDVDTELTASAPPIELDVTGAVRAIHMSPRLDFVPLFEKPKLDAYYRARRVFDHLLRDPSFEIKFLLNDGDLVMFDNARLLHGRTAFDPSEGLRHLQGCYIDIDGPRSLYRVLRRRLSTAEEARA